MTHRRRGHSLIECSLVLVLLAATLGAVTAILHVLYQADGRLRDQLAQDRALERLAAQLRADAHQASSAKAASPAGQPGSTESLLLALPNEQTTRYAILPQRLERVVVRGETMESRETYHLPSLLRAQWRIPAERTPPLVSLVLELRSGREPDGQAAGRTYRVDAAIQLVPPQLTSFAP
jgi:hypothetical protein